MANKTLANCTLAEFLRQANKIRHAVSDFWDECKIGDIVNGVPVIPADATAEDKENIIRKFSKQKISDILDACLDTNAEKTVEIIGLMCFKSAEEAAQMDASEFFDVAFELLGSERVVSFFTKMASSGLIDTVKP